MIKKLDPNPIQAKSSSKQIKDVCFYTFIEQDALSTVRMIGPARHLGLEVIRGVEQGQVYVERSVSADIVVLQRDFPRAIEAYENILSMAHNHHIPVVLDLDELLFELPEAHPDRLHHTYASSLLPTFQALLEVDLVTVTTPQLRNYVQPFNKHVIVLPNFLDDQIWQLKPINERIKSTSKIIIAYVGGLTHPPDLLMVAPVIKVLTGLYPDRLEFHFWGAEPPHELATNTSVHWHDQILWNYLDFASYFQAQPIDIFVAPLADNVFNNCKSSIKYLEYGSLGVPGVYSDVSPYRSVIKHGENGLLAHTAEDWLDCLTRLIENTELRYKLAHNAMADIQKNWLLSKKATLWRTAYQKARKFTGQASVADSAMHKMIRNLSHQLAAYDRDIKRPQEQLKQKIVELENQIAQQDTALSEITNSRTWKLASLFRRKRTTLVPPDR